MTVFAGCPQGHDPLQDSLAGAIVKGQDHNSDVGLETFASLTLPQAIDWQAMLGG